VSVYTDEADLNAVVRAVGLLDVSVCKSKAHLSYRRRPSNGRTDTIVSSAFQFAKNNFDSIRFTPENRIDSNRFSSTVRSTIE